MLAQLVGAESSTGYADTDAFISVFSSAGSRQWAKRLGGTGADIGYGVAVNSANSVIVTGSITGNADMNGDGDYTDGGAESNSGAGAFVSVFDSAGNWEYAKRVTQYGNDLGRSVIVAPNGGLT
ncbi:MAG: hypothetical protein IT292_10150 [Deltaproteobacteria bacterium]|nr:hypothetical protein [Deltaproteobacteria bacterium]